jgi:DNA-binding NtrC family response regulator
MPRVHAASGRGANFIKRTKRESIIVQAGRLARRAYGRPNVKLLLADVGLPGRMNGGQLADEAERLRAGLKVLFTSGYALEAVLVCDSGGEGWPDHGCLI